VMADELQRRMRRETRAFRTDRRVDRSDSEECRRKIERLQRAINYRPCPRSTRSQSCPWVGLTHGLGWVGSGWVTRNGPMDNSARSRETVWRPSVCPVDRQQQRRPPAGLLLSAGVSNRYHRPSAANAGRVVSRTDGGVSKQDLLLSGSVVVGLSPRSPKLEWTRPTGPIAWLRLWPRHEV